MKTSALAAGTGSSVVIESCQICGSTDLESIFFIGYMPPVNKMRQVGEVPIEQPSYPANLLYCSKCELVQLGLSIDPHVLFPPDYPYTSGTTQILRDNFADLHRECCDFLKLGANDLIVDIGSNDGTLLSNFRSHSHRVLGVEPTETGKIAVARDIPTVSRYFRPEIAHEICSEYGAAQVVTSTNCFAHIEDVHAIVEGILELLSEGGIFISESHYLIGLLDRLQYDTIYHEHLRYYSLHSLKYLLEMHGLEVIDAHLIPTHGGSIRVFAARKGAYPIKPSVGLMLASEPSGPAMRLRMTKFRREVMLSKLRLLSLLRDVKEKGARVCGISAPSRSSTLVNYVGLNDSIVDYVAEVRGSLKIGKYVPGTVIPVIEETHLFEDQPDYALMFSWHIADELTSKLRKRGYTGKFIIPLPDPRIV